MPVLVAIILIYFQERIQDFFGGGVSNHDLFFKASKQSQTDFFKIYYFVKFTSFYYFYFEL